MALEAVCGLNKMPCMKRFDALLKEWDLQEVQIATSNFRNPYSLMAPPFENVIIKSQFNDP